SLNDLTGNNAEKIKADKKLLMAANMELTEAEAKAFWPVYDEYQKELHKVNEPLIALRNGYATVTPVA
ncbi:MAG: hypothetical protein ACXWXL_21060, partial [Candidatus Binatia bacterium]